MLCYYLLDLEEIKWLQYKSQCKLQRWTNVWWPTISAVMESWTEWQNWAIKTESEVKRWKSQKWLFCFWERDKCLSWENISTTATICHFTNTLRPSPKKCKHDEMSTMKRQQSWPQKEENLEHTLLVTYTWCRLKFVFCIWPTSQLMQTPHWKTLLAQELNTGPSCCYSVNHYAVVFLVVVFFFTLNCKSTEPSNFQLTSVSQIVCFCFCKFVNIILIGNV